MSKEELEAPATIVLRETPTVELFHLQGYRVFLDSDLHREVTKRNERYKALFEKHDNVDLFQVSSAQTFNASKKTKEVQVDPPSTKDIGCEASTWDIYDSTMVSEEADDWDGTGATQTAMSKQVSEMVAMCLASPGSLLPITAEAEAKAANNSKAKAGLADGRKVLDELEKQRVLNSPNLQRSLRLVERVVEQTYFHEKHLRYRSLPKVVSMRENLSLPQDTDNTEPKLELQWSFKCALTKGRNVSSMAWNPVKSDLLAVSYGSFEFDKRQDGLILFWSLKNPEYPERVVRMDSGVTSIAFSIEQPFLLAAGLYDGTVAIFDVRKRDSKPILESDRENGKHADAVWQVKWVLKGGDHPVETLISLSTDGRVKEWSMKKGLMFSDLMLLKRVPNQTGPQWKPVKGKGEGIISRLGSGLCFDFATSTGDTALYYVGTEDGVVHKCSCSYNEQYLQNYHGHTGPVYKLRCHPLNPNVFISCSADWTIKLWDQSKAEAVLTFQQMDLTDVVNDVVWAPKDSTVFASVTGDGRVEIWDVSQTTLRPVICYHAKEDDPEPEEDEAKEDAPAKDDDGSSLDDSDLDDDSVSQVKTPEPEKVLVAKKKQLSCVRFAMDTQVLVTGDASGSVDVYKIFGMLDMNRTRILGLELERLSQAMQPDPMNK